MFGWHVANSEELTACERKQNESVNEEELDDVDDHPTERDLKRSQVRVYREQVYELES